MIKTGRHVSAHVEQKRECPQDTKATLDHGSRRQTSQRVFAVVRRVSVCPSVYLPVTTRYCIETAWLNLSAIFFERLIAGSPNNILDFCNCKWSAFENSDGITTLTRAFNIDCEYTFEHYNIHLITERLHYILVCIWVTRTTDSKPLKHIACNLYMNGYANS